MNQRLESESQLWHERAAVKRSAEEPFLDPRGERRGGAKDIEPRRLELDAVAHEAQPSVAQSSGTREVLEVGHGRFDAGAPAVDSAEGWSLLARPSSRQTDLLGANAD